MGMYRAGWGPRKDASCRGSSQPRHRKSSALRKSGCPAILSAGSPVSRTIIKMITTASSPIISWLVFKEYKCQPQVATEQL